MHRPGRFRSIVARVDRVVAPLIVFLLVYLVILIVPVVIDPPGSHLLLPWVALLAVLLATLAGRSTARDVNSLGLGLAGSGAGLARGTALALAIVGSTHLALVSTEQIVVRSGNGFPLTEVLVVFVPAVLHEELLFRGWAFQHLARWNQGAALLITSVLFAALHLGNRSVTSLALINIFIAGLILGLALLLYRTLWLPIAAHFIWNLLSGPILGHEVSGHRPERSVLVAIDSGSPLFSGGAFGIEASLVITLAQLIAVAFLAAAVRRRGHASMQS